MIFSTFYFLALTLNVDCRTAIESTTRFYDQNAASYAARHSGTSPNVERVRDLFLAQLKPGAVILDAGCGPGRDINIFNSRGYQAVGFDASNELVKEALKTLRTGVWVDTFQTLSSPSIYDGIWVMASLIHIPDSELPLALTNLRDALKVGGLMMISMIEGVGTPDKGEIEPKGRFFNRTSESRLRAIVATIPGLSIREDLSLRNPDDYHGSNKPSADFGFYNLFIERK